MRRISRLPLNYLRSFGELSFPDNAERDIYQIVRDWFSEHLLAADGPAGKRVGAPVEYYLMGRNEWLDADDWPPEETVSMSFYLASGGRLVTSLPAADAASYLYDPADPTPLIAGLGDERMDWQGMGWGFGHVPFDVAATAQRSDTLLFASEPLARPLAVAGPITVELYFSSSAQDTDMAAQLVDLTPDGRAIQLQHGLSRARFRRSYEHPEPLVPGEVAFIRLDLWSTAYELPAGHRLGLLISSAQWPAFDAHRNLYDDLASGTAMVPATQTLYLGSDLPSRLLLPVLNEPRRVSGRRSSAGR